MKYDKIHKVLGEGNFVPVVSEGSFAGKQTSFYDLFRVEKGKIAEHWDTIEATPPKDQWKNKNGKFLILAGASCSRESAARSHRYHCARSVLNERLTRHTGAAK